MEFLGVTVENGIELRADCNRWTPSGGSPIAVAHAEITDHDAHDTVSIPLLPGTLQVDRTQAAAWEPLELFRLSGMTDRLLRAYFYKDGTV